MFQLTVAENLNECLDGRGLALAKDYQYQKLQEYKALLTEKLYPMNHMRQIESETRSRFHTITKQIDEKIARHLAHAKAEEEKQKLKDKLYQKVVLKYVEAQTEKRLADQEQKVKKLFAKQQSKADGQLLAMERRILARVKK